MSILFVIVASFFNAIMDWVGDSVHFNGSIFKNRNPNFWNKDVSWNHAKKVFGYKFDAWHLSKSMMIVLLVFAICTHFTPIYKWWADIFILGFAWNISFDIFYYLLKSKK